MRIARPIIVILALGGLGANLHAWSWPPESEGVGGKTRFEAAFQTGRAFSHRGDDSTYWGEFGYRQTERRLWGIETAHFSSANNQRRLRLTVTNSGTPTVDYTQRDYGENKFYYLGPFWRGLHEGPALVFSYGVGAGAAIQHTRVRKDLIDHLQGGALTRTEKTYTHVNAALSLVIALDVKVTNNLLIGGGLRDLAVFRRKDPSGYPVDEVRPGNSFVPFAGAHFRW
jgi:hypothetical protein